MLVFLAIAIAVAGFFSYVRFLEIEKVARKSADTARQQSDTAADLANAIERIVQRTAEKAAEIDELTAKSAATAPDRATKVIEGAAANPEVSPFRSAIARAIHFQLKDQTTEASKIWRAIAVVSEGDDDKRATRAWFSSAYLLGVGREEEAIAQVGKAIELEPEMAGYYLFRGRLNHELGHHMQAVADFDKAFKLEPKDATADLRRAAEAAVGLEVDTAEEHETPVSPASE